MNILLFFTEFWCIFDYFPFMEDLSDHLFILLFFVSARE